MISFLVGFLIGLIVMDLLWAMKLGTIDLMRVRYKSWLAKRRHQKRAKMEKEIDILDSLKERN